MFRVITDVAEVIRNLETLNLIEQTSVALGVKFTDDCGYKITVRFETCMEYIKICRNMMESLRGKGHTMKRPLITATPKGDVTIQYVFYEKKEQSKT